MFSFAVLVVLSVAFGLQVRILRKLHHRNIVQFYGACLEPGSMFFVTELMKVGSQHCRSGVALLRIDLKLNLNPPLMWVLCMCHACPVSAPVAALSWHRHIHTGLATPCAC